MSCMRIHIVEWIWWLATEMYIMDIMAQKALGTKQIWMPKNRKEDVQQIVLATSSFSLLTNGCTSTCGHISAVVFTNLKHGYGIGRLPAHLTSDYITFTIKRKIFPKKAEFASHGLVWVQWGCKHKWNGNISVDCTDDYSRYTWNLFLRSKDETPERQLSSLEQNSMLFQDEGIELRLPLPRTPDRRRCRDGNRTLCSEDMLERCLFRFISYPLSFWAEAVATACYTQNWINNCI
ncbi:hypothetical protein Tco_0742611 [Tanacetum coccineum]